MKRTKIVTVNLIIALVAFSHAYGVKYYFANDGASPITVKIDMVAEKQYAKRSTTETVENMKPGEKRIVAPTQRINWRAQVIYLLKPTPGSTKLPLLPLSNVSPNTGDLKGKYYNKDLEGDYDIEFYQKFDNWYIDVKPHR